MDILTRFARNVASYRPCAVSDVLHFMENALMSAIVRELIRLGYAQFEPVLFDSNKMRIREMGNIAGVSYYLTGNIADNLNCVNVDGRNYGLLEVIMTADGDYNSNFLHLNLDTLERIYNYLCLERN